jgi:hypothetical protein
MRTTNIKYSYTPEELEDHLGIHYSIVSKAIKEMGGLLFQDLVAIHLVTQHIVVE